jgi:hypothetical protein
VLWLLTVAKPCGHGLQRGTSKLDVLNVCVGCVGSKGGGKGETISTTHPSSSVRSSPTVPGSVNATEMTSSARETAMAESGILMVTPSFQRSLQVPSPSSFSRSTASVPAPTIVSRQTPPIHVPDGSSVPSISSNHGGWVRGKPAYDCADGDST